MYVNNLENITRALKTLDWLLNQLPPQERKVIKYRFGFSLRRPLTLEEISQRMEISKERIRQIQNNGLERMKKELTV